jgi:hypothetical protein
MEGTPASAPQDKSQTLDTGDCHWDRRYPRREKNGSDITGSVYTRMQRGLPLTRT